MNTIPATTALDLEAIAEFFEALGVSFPEERTAESLHEFKLAQDRHFAETVNSYQKLRTVWQKEWLKLQQLLDAREQKPKAIAAATALEIEAYDRFAALQFSLLAARGREEVARVLPAALTESRWACFAARQLETAKLYLKLS